MSKTNKEVTFWSILDIFVKWRRLLAFVFILTTLLTYIITLFLPKFYTSNASLFPPEKESNSLGLASSLLGGGFGSLLSGSGMSLPTFATLADVYAAVIQSRTVAEEVIEKHNLQEVYDCPSMEKAVRELHSRLGVRVEPNGMINISVEDREPERASLLVSSFIKELNRINKEVRIDKARATRMFIEERLQQTKVDLKNAEEDFKDFQEKHKTISLDNQIAALIDNVAQLKSKLVMSQIELGVLRNTLQPSHTRVLQKEAEITEIKKQLDRMESGDGQEEDDVLSIPFSEAPDLGLELARLMREYKIQETIFELLTQQHEQAKISEKRDTPTIQVLDSPTIPEKRSRPKRTILALIAAVLASLFATVAVFIKEFLDRQKKAGTEVYTSLDNALNSFKDDFYALRAFFASKKGSNG